MAIPAGFKKPEELVNFLSDPRHALEAIPESGMSDAFKNGLRFHVMGSKGTVVSHTPEALQKAHQAHKATLKITDGEISDGQHVAIAGPQRVPDARVSQAPSNIRGA